MNFKFMYQVLRGHQCEDVLADFCDGSHYRTHPLFSKDPKALQIILYYDDVEIVNPLGSKAKKHKLGMYSSVCYVIASKLE